MEPPKAFASYASEDDAIARPIAKALREEKGIDVFFAPWEVLAGGSLVRKINEGLRRSDVFILFLSAYSLEKVWPKAEQEAAMVQMIEDDARVIPVNLGVDRREIPPLLRRLKWVSVPNPDSLESAISEIAASVFRHYDKPGLGPIPPFAAATTPTFPDRPSLGLADRAVLRILFELGQRDGLGSAVGFERLAPVAAEKGIDAGMLTEALDFLKEDGLVEFKRLMGGAIPPITVRTSAVEYCCKALVPDYPTRKRTILAAVGGDRTRTVTTNEKVAEETEEPLWLVGHVLRDAARAGYLKLQPVRVGHERYSVHSITEHLRRLLDRWRPTER
jgi:TIR domain